MAFLDFISCIHNKTQRNYVQRVTDYDKAACAKISKQFGKDYFDGDRQYGYGGYKYDGRWIPFTQKLIEHYGLKAGDKVLDIGCGKGFIVHDFEKNIPGLTARGVDISDYAIENCMPEVKGKVQVANATKLPFGDHEFDLVVSINTLHNLRLPDLEKAFHEIQRVGKGKGFVVMDSYRTEEEKVNLLYWQVTCECFYTPDEWEWLFKKFGYTGDADFVCFE